MIEVLANTMGGNYFAIYSKYQINMLYTLNLHNVIRQLYLNRSGGWPKKLEAFPSISETHYDYKLEMFKYSYVKWALSTCKHIRIPFLI